MLFLHKSALLYRYPIFNEHSYYFKSVKTIEGSARKLQIKQKKKVRSVSSLCYTTGDDATLAYKPTLIASFSVSNPASLSFPSL
jgi:hypothetical protein